MIKFFRKIRQKLLVENRFNKYLLYASGEIILVVIGILIALQINNWNEKRSTEKHFQKILIEMRKDLETDIINSEPLLKDGYEIDSLSNLILDEKFTKEDYLNNGSRDLFWVSLQYNPYDYQKTAFKKFENFQGIIPPKYDTIFKDINHYYINLGQFYDDVYLGLRQRVKSHHDYLVNHTNWYYKMRNGDITDDMIDFYLNNPIYKNWVSQHKADNTTGKQGRVKLFQTAGFVLQQRLTQIIGDSYKIKDEDIAKKFGKPILNAKEYIGEYEISGSDRRFRINQINGYLLQDNLEIIKETKKDTFFYINYPEFINVFTRDTNGTVIGAKFINLKDSTRNRTAIKIK